MGIFSSLFPSTLKRIKLTIQNGHRNATNGETGTSGITSAGVKINEVDQADAVFYEIKKIIDADEFLSATLILAYDDAYCRNALSSDYFIALHCDGSANDQANGGFVDDNPLDSVYEESMKFAKAVADSYFQGIGIAYVNRQTPASKTYFGFNYTGPSTKQFIIEQGFMTNKQEMDKLSDYRKIAELMVKGIIDYMKDNDADYKKALAKYTSNNENLSEIETLKQSIKTLQTQHIAELAEKDRQVLKTLNDKKNRINEVLTRSIGEITNIINSS